MIPLTQPTPETATAKTTDVSKPAVVADGAPRFGDFVAFSESNSDAVPMLAGDLSVLSESDEIVIDAALPFVIDEVPKKGAVTGATDQPVLLPEKATLHQVQAKQGPEMTVKPERQVLDRALPVMQGQDMKFVHPKGAMSGATGDAASRPPTVAQTVVEGRIPVLHTPEARDAVPQPSRQIQLDQTPTTQSTASPPTVKTYANLATDRGAEMRPDKLYLPDELARPAREEAAGRMIERQDWQTAARQPSGPVAALVAQPPAVTTQMMTKFTKEMSEKVLKITDAENVVAAMPAERQIAGGGIQSTMGTSAGPETARQAATQIATALTNSNGKATEIALNPEELGRVKLSLAAGDGMITVHVLAERPETQDLLRRHIDVLAQEFRQLGYGSISFSFGEQKQQADSEQKENDLHLASETQDTAPPAATKTLPTSSGLDLRV